MHLRHVVQGQHAAVRLAFLVRERRRAELDHALAFARTAVAQGHLQQGDHLVINLSGRGDKDLETYFGICREREKEQR